MKTTVLHYTGSSEDVGGIHAVVRALAEAGRCRYILGVSPPFVQRHPSRLRLWRGPRVIGDLIGPRNTLSTFVVAWHVRRWLRRGWHRIYHGHSRAGLMVALWLRFLGEQRVVVSVHCYGRQRWFYRWAAARFGGRLFWLTPAMKVHYGVGIRTWEGCIPNGLPENPRVARKAARTSGRLVVGGAGMLVRWKGWHLVIEALALLPVAVRTGMEFRHIGTTDGSRESAAYARELMELAEQRGVATQVRWLGWQPSLAPMLTEIDCLLVASDHEPFSMAALEAMFAGVPVLAADSGGPTDLITAGRNGWFFRTGDAQDLARALAVLAQGDALAGAEIDAAALRRFTTPEVARQWVDVYGRAFAMK